MLIAESEDGQYEPVAVVGTIREAREVALEDLRLRACVIKPGAGIGVLPVLTGVAYYLGPVGSHSVP